MKPQYGLIAKPRLYRCDCCGDEHYYTTNHTGPGYWRCPGCSWRGATDSAGNFYNALRKERPQHYCGPEVTIEEFNPHARTG